MALRSSEVSSIIYHDIFDYPLTSFELKKWKLNSKIKIKSKKKIAKKNNLYFLKGREVLIQKRIKREKYFKDKLKIAQKAIKVLSIVPTIRFVGLTGALAMNNADKNSDIDFLIITKKNTLWRTRLISYLLLIIAGIKIRKPKDKNEKDKLCLNMWIDETNLVWEKNERNIYSAHELAQIHPLLNKNKTYEKLLGLNSWILDFWPSAVSLDKKKANIKQKAFKKNSIIEDIFYYIQFLYMKNKITREVVTKNRAIFHPNDWGKMVIDKFSS